MHSLMFIPRRRDSKQVVRDSIPDEVCKMMSKLVEVLLTVLTLGLYAEHVHKAKSVAERGIAGLREREGVPYESDTVGKRERGVGECGPLSDLGQSFSAVLDGICSIQDTLVEAKRRRINPKRTEPSGVCIQLERLARVEGNELRALVKEEVLVNARLAIR